MTKQLRATFAAMLVASSVPALAQTTTTTTKTKKAPDAVTTTTTTKTLKKGASSTGTRTGTSRTVAKRKPVVHRESATEAQIRELRMEMQGQIDGLKQQLADRDAKLSSAQVAIQSAQDQASAANTQAQSVQTVVQQNTETLSTLKSNVADLQVSNTGLAQTINTNKTELQQQIESPTTIHYKGVTITPVAFFAFETVYRTRSINSGLNTPFNSTPFQGANEAHVSELNFSGRQSRLGGLFEGNAGAYKLSGYFEADFLSAGTTSNYNQSNSFTLRQRQIWGQAATKGGFAVTGGQMWSLVTETGKATNNRTEKLPNTIDPQYMVGFNWARQPAIRIQQTFGNPFFGKGSALTLAASLEQAQLTGFTAANAPNNFFFGAPGQSGGLLNAFNQTPTNNVAPDVFVKAAVDLPHAHFEAGGVARFFRTRYYPAVLTAGTGVAATRPGEGPSNDVEFGGGVFGSARVSVNKFVDLAAQGMGGQGIGRYGSSQLADATVRPTGKLEPLRSYHALLGVETHPTPKLDVYGYAGGEYVQRTYYPTLVAGSPYTGYGTPNTNVSGCNIEAPVTASGNTGSIAPAGTCAAVTRAIYEGTAGATYRIISSPKYGRLQYQVTYSYLTKNAWQGLQSGTFGAANASFFAPKATNNMVFTGMRYYIP